MNTRFELDDLIKTAKRENNTKRSYLYVNPVQGKHIPVSPSRSTALFSLLAERIEQSYSGERLLIIGFAETATAIGSAIACRARNVKYYMNTTREDIGGAEYLFFTESHSHATEQRLVVSNFDSIPDNIDRIVFAEDEVTTGNTIEKLIRVISLKYKDRISGFGIISILNSMSDERIRQLSEKGIACDYLYRIPSEYKAEGIDGYRFQPLSRSIAERRDIAAECVTVGDYWNCRLVNETAVIRQKTEAFINSALSHICIKPGSKQVLVLGTEEFMYPAMLLGARLEKEYPELNISFHATTRSPIEVSLDEGYPLNNRSPLRSVYESGRNTFIYNLKRYDQVIIVTDAAPIAQDGLESIIGALEQYGNDDIMVIRWEDAENAD